MKETAHGSKLLATILDAVADPVFVKNTDHQWIYANQAFAEFVGIPLDAVIGHTDADYFPPDQVAVFYAKDDEAFEQGGVIVNEEELTTSSGEKMIISTKKTVTADEEGNPVLVGIIRDLTALRATQEEVLHRRAKEIQAREASAAKSHFLANMSHELRTPLTAIIGYSEMLDEEVDGELRSWTDAVLSSARHLLGMVDDILDLSRIEAGHSEGERVVFDLPKCLAETAAMLPDQGSRIRTQCTVERWRSDPQAIRQIVLNLVSNAYKFSEGEVVVEAGLQGEQLRICVRDTGEGIPESELEALFVKFWRGPRIATSSQGTGLGLSIARQLAQSLGGTLTAESEQGRGTALTLLLPGAV